MIYRFKLFFILIVVTTIAGYSQPNFNTPYDSVESYKLNMEYVNSLSNRADFFFNSGNYEKAIRISKEKLAILNLILGQNSLEYALSEAELALFIANIGRYKESIFIAENALNKIEKIEGKESVLYAATADKISKYYSLLGDYDKALLYIKRAVAVFEKAFGTSSDYYISSKSGLATTYNKLHKIRDAIELQKECNEYYKSKGDSVNYAIGLHDLSLSYAACGDYTKALNYCETSSKMLLHHLGQDDLLYRESLKTLADYYVEIGDYDKVHTYSTAYVQLCKKYCGDNSYNYIKALSNQAFYYSKEGNFRKSIELEGDILSLLEKEIILDSLDNTTSLSNLAIFNRNLGSVDKSITRSEQSLNMLPEYSNITAYRKTLSDLSNSYMLLGDFEKAIEEINKVLDTFQENKGSEYYGYLSDLANCYYNMNQIEKAISIYTEVLQRLKLLKGRKNLDYASILEKLVLCYSGIEHYRDAITTQNECVEVLLSILGERNSEYAFSLLTLGYLYRCIGEDKKSIELQEKAVEIFNDVSESGIQYIDAINQLIIGYRDNEPEYALQLAEKAYGILKKNFSRITSTHIRCFQNLVYIYISLGLYDNAKKICYKDLENPVVHEYLLKNTDDYVLYLRTKSRLSFALKDFENALNFEKKALDVTKNVDNGAYELGVINMLMNYLSLNDTTSAIELIKDSNFVEEFRDKIMPNINSLTSKNRFSYWGKISKLFTDVLPILALVSKDSTLICQTYDYSALFAKSLLLRNEIRISEIVRNSNEASLQIQYKKYQDNLSFINNSLQDSLTRFDLIKENIALEDKIRQQLLSLRLIPDIYATWKDVQQSLGQDDVAIEFLSIQLGNNNDGYIALVNKKGYLYPHLYTLSDTETLNSVRNDSPSALYNLIWDPLRNELDNTNNIFFSPAGQLHNLGIEYLNDSTGHYLFEKHAIYRLSSTQELLYSSPSKLLQSAVLYGGLDYSSASSSILNEKTNCKEDFCNTYMSDSFVRSINERGGFDPLYGTYTEIKIISELLQDGKIKCRIFTENKGTEESFKSLVSIQPDILHIATHGMYIKIDDKENLVNNGFSFILSEDDNNYHPEDIALTRSFIVMSGGNQLIQRDSIPLNSEDGIVTAQEISHMDLHKIDIVVLSACQTGLGDISNEGVFGLQRGFKKAGVKTILMSLDKVDDEATRILMVEFYRNLMNGKTKRQSLLDAQQYLRKVENGKYDDPKYWASFIMLDGIN